MLMVLGSFQLENTSNSCLAWFMFSFGLFGLILLKVHAFCTHLHFNVVPIKQEAIHKAQPMSCIVCLKNSR